mgnify:CR=1 FL=1
MSWRIVWDWLSAPVMPTFSLEELERERRDAYQIGVTQGELLGRQALSEEIQQMFPPGHAIDADDAANIKARQAH